jgi:hypothetical protein
MWQLLPAIVQIVGQLPWNPSVVQELVWIEATRLLAMSEGHRCLSRPRVTIGSAFDLATASPLPLSFKRTLIERVIYSGLQ